jgi:hypothetical protein
MGHRAGGLVLGVVVCLGLSIQAVGQGAPAADEIVTQMLAKNQQRQAGLNGFTSDRTYTLEYKGTGGEHHGKIRVHAEYLGAGQKRLTVIEESGSKVICERVLRKMVESEQEAAESANRMQTTLSPANYNLQLVGQESLDGVPTWILQVSPKEESKFTYRGRVWVSEADYALVRVQGEPAKNPSWWINRASFDWRYGRHGEFWLPAKSVAASHVRIGGDATLTIDYGEYHSQTDAARETATAAAPQAQVSATK